jgi:preprotein translocase subunit YajC
MSFIWQTGGMVLMFGVLYLLFLRPAMNQEKERATLQNSLQKNDKVLTSGGIYGTVVSIVENADELLLRVDDQVKIRVTRSGVVRNFTREEAAKTPATPG